MASKQNSADGTKPVWVKAMSTKRNMPYYYNIKTQESIWHKPEGCEITENTERNLNMNSDPESSSENILEEEIFEQIVKDPKVKLNTVNSTQVQEASAQKIRNSMSKKNEKDVELNAVEIQIKNDVMAQTTPRSSSSSSHNQQHTSTSKENYVKFRRKNEPEIAKTHPAHVSRVSTGTVQNVESNAVEIQINNEVMAQTTPRSSSSSAHNQQRTSTLEENYVKFRRKTEPEIAKTQPAVPAHVSRMSTGMVQNVESNAVEIQINNEVMAQTTPRSSSSSSHNQQHTSTSKENYVKFRRKNEPEIAKTHPAHVSPCMSTDVESNAVEIQIKNEVMAQTTPRSSSSSSHNQQHTSTSKENYVKFRRKNEPEIAKTHPAHVSRMSTGTVQSKEQEGRKGSPGVLHNRRRTYPLDIAQNQVYGLVQQKKQSIKDRLGRNSINSSSESLPQKQNGGNNVSSRALKRKLPLNIQDLRCKLLKKKNENELMASNSTLYEMEWEESQPTWVKEPCKPPDVLNLNEKTPILTVPSYSMVYLVCDTCVLLKDEFFLEQLLHKKIYQGIPVSIIIPYVVLLELGKISSLNKHNAQVSHTARKVQKIIDAYNTENNYNLILQSPKAYKRIVSSLEINNNDDYVLNCCLQYKEKCSENELAILVTCDVNLKLRATTFQLTVHDWNTFREMARTYKEQQQSVQEKVLPPVFPQNVSLLNEDRMEVDMDESEQNPDLKTNEQQFTDGDALVHLNEKNLRNYLWDFMKRFQIFMNNVLEEAINDLYEGDLKELAYKVKPTWTLLDYIMEMNNRWPLITSHYVSTSDQKILTSLIQIVKKYRCEKDEFTFADVEKTLSICQDFANIFIDKYVNTTTEFLKELKDLRENIPALLSNLKMNQSNVSDVEPVDLALQNIYNCLNLDYENWKNRLTSDNDNSEPCTDDLSSLTLLFEQTNRFRTILERSLQIPPDTITTADEAVLHLQSTVLNFCDEEGISYSFDFSVENIVELLQDESCRSNLKQTLEKFKKLHDVTDELIEKTN